MWNKQPTKRHLSCEQPTTVHTGWVSSVTYIGSNDKDCDLYVTDCNTTGVLEKVLGCYKK